MLQKLKILIDYDDNGYLLQIFTKPVQVQRRRHFDGIKTTFQIGKYIDDDICSLVYFGRDNVFEVIFLRTTYSTVQNYFDKKIRHF